jgi:hypothetical protein
MAIAEEGGVRLVFLAYFSRSQRLLSSCTEHLSRHCSRLNRFCRNCVLAMSMVVVVFATRYVVAQKAARRSLYKSNAVDRFANICDTMSSVVRTSTRGLPGTKRSTSASAQQAICTMRRAAMQKRKEVSLDMSTVVGKVFRSAANSKCVQNIPAFVARK